MTVCRVGLVFVAAMLIWKIVALNLSEYYLRRAYDGNTAALQTSLFWYEHPEALEFQARQLIEAGENTAAAVEGLRHSLSLAPTAARPAATLGLLHAAEGRPDATLLASLADRLAPVDWRAQNDLARLYASLGRLAEAVPHLARAMTGNMDLALQYFPILADIAATPGTLGLLTPVTEDPRDYPWWNRFFSFVAREVETVDALRGLVQLRESASAYPLQVFERNHYVERLRRDGLMTEAYLYWVNGLPRDELDALAYVFDGGFQRSFDNDTGFGWHASPPRNSGIRVSLSDTYGARGDSALRVSFRGRRVRFRHVWQHVFLPPGIYTVSGRVRTDQLRARRGLQWRLDCATGESGPIGESELFSGSGDWRGFTFTVSINELCSGQTLRLYSAGDRDVDHEVSGTIWFDDLRIELQR